MTCDRISIINGEILPHGDKYLKPLGKGAYWCMAPRSSDDPFGGVCGYHIETHKREPKEKFGEQRQMEFAL